MIVATASFWMSSLNLQISPSQVVWPRIVQVLGAGMMFVPINTVAYRFIPKDQTSNASGLFSLVRNEGASVGVATVTTLLQRFTQTHQARLAEHINPLNPLATDTIQKVSGAFTVAGDPGTAQHAGLGVVYGMIQRQAAVLSYLDLFRLFGVVILLTIPLVMLMKRAAASKDAMTAH
jgi:DHA2 family multidrug resistance protein